MGPLTDNEMKRIKQEGGRVYGDCYEEVRFYKTCKPSRAVKKLLASRGYQITNASGAKFNPEMTYMLMNNN